MRKIWCFCFLCNQHSASQSTLLTMVDECCCCYRGKILTHDEMLVKLLTDNFSDVSYIFRDLSDGDSDSGYRVIRRQNKTVPPLSD